MPNDHSNAICTVLAVDADGREFELTLAVGRAYRVNEVQWSCPVSMTGLYERLVDIAGVDSWQATQLAFRLIADLLESFIEQGGRLMWTDSREPLALADLFPQLSRQR